MQVFAGAFTYKIDQIQLQFRCLFELAIKPSQLTAGCRSNTLINHLKHHKVSLFMFTAFPHVDVFSYHILHIR